MNNEINYVSPFRRFCITIGNLPTAYLESMSYYEGLTYLVNYLSNNVIPAVNNNGEVVEELQNYVANYFDNLDVQEEINNKLDEMAEDGTLYNLIKEYLNTKPAIFGFDTVADMKLSTDLSDGSIAQTLGFYSINDGGNASYKIREKTTLDIIDEMYILSLSDNTLVAELVINNEINSKQCGLVGDGTTDETIKLNTFFASKTDHNKVLNNGVYKITDTLFIKGKWRRDSNTNQKIRFDNATILYTGTAGGVSIVLYNMFKYNIEGLCITRNSNKNSIQVIGCWHCLAVDWDIQDLDITHDNTLISDQTYQTLSSEYLSYINCYLKGTLTINCSAPDYINCVNFYNTIIYSTDNYCVKLLGTNSKQEINFYNSDLSYCETAVFYVENTQIGGCTVNCIGTYFDSAKKLFYNDNKNGLEFNNLFTMMPANSNAEIANIEYKDWTTNMSLGGYGQFGYNLPTSNVNYVLNGDMSTTNETSGDYGLLMGNTSGTWTKSYIDSNLSTSGKARKLEYAGAGSTQVGITARAVAAPRDNTYTGYIRAKITSGSCDSIQLGLGGKYVTVDTSRLGDKEFVIVNSKYVTRSAGDSLNLGVEFVGNVTAGFAIEFYEVGVIDGKTYIPNARLHGAAVIPNP